MDKCSGCGAAISWIKTPKGNSIPVNPDYIEIDPDGIKHEAIVTDDGRVVKGSRTAATQDTLFPSNTTIRGRIPHFATCPQSARFKGG